MEESRIQRAEARFKGFAQRNTAGLSTKDAQELDDQYQYAKESYFYLLECQRKDLLNKTKEYISISHWGLFKLTKN